MHYLVSFEYNQNNNAWNTFNIFMITKYLFLLNFLLNLCKKSYGYVLYHAIFFLNGSAGKNPPAM